MLWSAVMAPTLALLVHALVVEHTSGAALLLDVAAFTGSAGLFPLGDRLASERRTSIMSRGRIVLVCVLASQVLLVAVDHATLYSVAAGFWVGVGIIGLRNYLWPWRAPRNRSRLDVSGRPK